MNQKSEQVRVLLTGSAGFIGHETGRVLKEEGYIVVPFDLFHDQDLGQPEDLELLQYDAVIHLAAVSSTPWAREKPAEAFWVNVQGTYNLMMDAYRKGVKRVVVASSSRILDLPGRCFDNPYVVTKYLEEQVCKMFIGKMVIQALRYTSVYGPTGFQRTHSLNILNQIVKAAMEGSQVKIFGDGSQKRDFVHVNDVARANVLALQATENMPAEPIPYQSSPVDIGSGQSYSLVEIIKKVGDISDRNLNVLFTGEYPDDYMMLQKANVEQAYHRFGYFPRNTIEGGIKECMQSS